MLWDDDIPRQRSTDDDGRATEITVDRGRLGGLEPPPPPPDSWASRPEADVAIWHVVIEPGAAGTLPPARGADTVRTLYVFEGSVRIGEHDLEASTGAVLRCDEPVVITAGPYGAEALVLQGRPIGEPVAQYGPFVMNDEAGIEQAFADYRRSRLRRLALADRRPRAPARRTAGSPATPTAASRCRQASARAKASLR